MPVISLIHPSRGRPEQAWATANKWLDRSGVPTEHILSVDWGDPLLDVYSDLFGVAWNKCLADNDSVVQATNRAARVAKGNIFVYLSDDFDCPQDWGKKIVDLGYQAGPWIVKVDDGLQKFNSRIITMPIMSRELYADLGYVWHPAYKSMYVDNDLYMTCQRRGVIKYHSELLFQHNHYSNGKAPVDDTYRRSEAWYEQGKATFEKRKQKGFI